MPTDCRARALQAGQGDQRDRVEALTSSGIHSTSIATPAIRPGANDQRESLLSAMGVPVSCEGLFARTVRMLAEAPITPLARLLRV